MFPYIYINIFPHVSYPIIHIFSTYLRIFSTYIQMLSAYFQHFPTLSPSIIFTSCLCQDQRAMHGPWWRPSKLFKGGLLQHPRRRPLPLEQRCSVGSRRYEGMDLWTARASKHHEIYIVSSWCGKWMVIGTTSVFGWKACCVGFRFQLPRIVLFWGTESHNLAQANRASASVCQLLISNFEAFIFQGSSNIQVGVGLNCSLFIHAYMLLYVSWRNHIDHLIYGDLSSGSVT